VSLTLSQLARPSYAGGYARSAGESAYPDDWKGLAGLWVPSLGATGQTLRDVSGEKNHGTLNSATWGSGFLTTFSTADVTVGSNLGILQATPGATVIAVVRSTNLSSSRVIFHASKNGASASARASLDTNGTSWRMGGRSLDADSFQSASGGTASTGVWYTTVGTLDYANDLITICVDGKQIVSSGVSFGAAASSDTTSDVVTVGSVDSLNHFRGDIAFVGVYGFAIPLSAAMAISADPYRMLRPVRHMPYATGEAPPAGTTLHVFHGLIEASETGDTVLSVFAPWWDADADEDEAGTILPQMMHHLLG